MSSSSRQILEASSINTKGATLLQSQPLQIQDTNLLQWTLEHLVMMGNCSKYANYIVSKKCDSKVHINEGQEPILDFILGQWHGSFVLPMDVGKKQQ